MSVTVAQVRTQIADRPQIFPPMSAAPEIIGYGDSVATAFALTFENAIPGTLTVYSAPPPTDGAPPAFAAVSPNAPVAVATTAAAAIPTPGVVTVTPGAMTNITVGVSLRIDPGLASQEDVKVTAVSGSTFTAAFAQAHAAGYSIVGTPAYWVGAPSSGTNGTAATNQIITFLAAPAAGSLIAARYQATAFSDADLAAYLARAIANGYDTDDTTLLKRVHFDLIDVILTDQRRMEILSQGDFRRDPAAYVMTLQRLKESIRKDLAGGTRPGSDAPALGIGGGPARRYLPRR